MGFPFSFPPRASSRAFTLVELLIVIAVIAVVAVTVVIVINPAELVRQGRDANRLSDVDSLVHALNIYASQGGAAMGSANTVYISIPDPAATSTAGDQCQGLGLPALPSVYIYHCAATSTYRNTDGTGWLPTPFASLTQLSLLSSLPVDPTNTSSSRLYYAYATDGTRFEVTAPIESAKFRLGGAKDAIGPDGGNLASVYERGSQLGLEPLDYGDSSLIGYWRFDEGSGAIAYDYSGNNNYANWANATQNYAPGKIGAYAGRFDGTASGPNATTQSGYTTPSSMTVVFWTYFNSLAPNYQFPLNSTPEAVWRAGLHLDHLYFDPGVHSDISTAISVTSGTWHQFAMTGKNVGGSDIYEFYIDAVSVASGSIASNINSVSSLGFNDALVLYPANALIDDVRVYSRVLSASEIQLLFNWQK